MRESTPSLGVSMLTQDLSEISSGSDHLKDHSPVDLLSLPSEIVFKYQKLKQILKEAKAVVIAYSGGVDSTFLLRVAVDTLGDRAVAITAISESYPEWEWVEAQALAQEMGARLIEVKTYEMDREGYRANAGDRCYHCKAELFDVASLTQQREGLEGQLCYGAIVDDLGDHRPGMNAASERDAHTPLIEANLCKKDVRILSRALGLRTWDKPASACLSSRFPYGIEITPQRLEQIGRCEARLMMLGLRVFRARYHGDLVRIELGEEEMERLWVERGLQTLLVRECKAVGFKYVSIDLEGYRSGSANEVLVSLGGV